MYFMRYENYLKNPYIRRLTQPPYILVRSARTIAFTVPPFAALRSALHAIDLTFRRQRGLSILFRTIPAMPTALRAERMASAWSTLSLHNLPSAVSVPAPECAFSPRVSKPRARKPATRPTRRTQSAHRLLRSISDRLQHNTSSPERPYSHRKAAPPCAIRTQHSRIQSSYWFNSINQISSQSLVQRENCLRPRRGAKTAQTRPAGL